MDLYATFQSDLDAQEKGVWYEIGGGASIRVARRGNPRHQAAMRVQLEQHRSVVDTGQETPELLREIERKAAAKALLVDWKGLTKGGEEFAYSVERATEVLLDPTMEDLWDVVDALSRNAERYRVKNLEQDAKN